LSLLPSAPEELVSQWIDAFNLRDLDGMLDCMSPEVRFYPLRLSGLERFYQGHDLEEGSEPARFWARDRVEDGGIVVAHHYLTDPDIFDGIAKPPRPHGRLPRFPGM